MKHKTLTVRSAPHPKLHYVVSEDGQTLTIPDQWACLKPGDAAVTKAVKALGPSWTAVRKKGRKIFSDGVWAPCENIEKARAQVAVKRSDPSYAKKRASDLKRREKKQSEYEASFFSALIEWLNFHPRYKTEAEQMALAITAHAVPVGSGTVARTERIPLDERARAAAIAWMRHQTTAYDSMRIARVKGRRREVRRELARQSVQILGAYRTGREIDKASCPLARALREQES